MGAKTHCTAISIAQLAVPLTANVMPDIIVSPWLGLVDFGSVSWAVIGLVPSC